MKIYVAGASAELERAESAIASLRAAGHEITHDWPAVIRKVRIEGGRSDAELGQAERERHARDDLDAVDRADAFWLLVPEVPSTGAWLEIGFAFGLAWPTDSQEGPPLIIASGKHRAALFLSLVDEAFDDDTHALAFLLGYGSGA